MKYLITGCSGYLGVALTKRLLKEGHKVIGLARNEKNLVEFKQKFPEVEILIGDVSNEWCVRDAMRGVDGVFHFAAQKAVDLAEKNVMSCILSNVIGTMNILKVSFEVKPKFVLFVSTDKARQVSGVYGATKLLGERLMSEAERINTKTDYRTVVYGNVLFSSGSVLCKWKDKMQKGESVMITDPEMTRFFWSVDEAIDHIFDCLKQKDSTPYTPNMKSMKMSDLLEAMMHKYGIVEVEVIGNRGGENQHETLGNDIWSNKVERFTIDEIKTKI